mmetsp:Transcript_93/g.243  ORF Transcript_93/g.243 Transcript_93/m.243 type:complete len:224 (+) Transcript_93:153-824(+)
MLRGFARKSHALMRADLRGHDKTPNFFHERIVCRRRPVQKPTNLSAQIRDRGQSSHNILRDHIGDAAFAHLVCWNIDVSGAQVKVRRGKRAYAPVGAARKCVLLVIGRCCHQHLIAVFVGGFGGFGRHLRLLSRGLFDLRNLLSLQRWRSNLSAQNDVSDFSLRERRDVDIVLFPVIDQNHVFQGNFDSNPIFVAQSGPHVMRLRHDRWTGPQNNLCSLRTNM